MGRWPTSDDGRHRCSPDDRGPRHRGDHTGRCCCSRGTTRRCRAHGGRSAAPAGECRRRTGGVGGSVVDRRRGRPRRCGVGPARRRPGHPTARVDTVAGAARPPVGRRGGCVGRGCTRRVRSGSRLTRETGRDTDRHRGWRRRRPDALRAACDPERVAAVRRRAERPPGADEDPRRVGAVGGRARRAPGGARPATPRRLPCSRVRCCRPDHVRRPGQDGAGRRPW